MPARLTVRSATLARGLGLPFACLALALAAGSCSLPVRATQPQTAQPQPRPAAPVVIEPRAEIDVADRPRPAAPVVIEPRAEIDVADRPRPAAPVVIEPTAEIDFADRSRPAAPAAIEPTAEIDFADRFDRMPKDPEPWRVVRGTWQLENVTNRMAYNAIPVTNASWIKRWGELRANGPEEWIKRSPNSLRYFGKSDDWAMAITGDPMWRGYRFEASGRSLSRAIGVVLGYQDPCRFYLLHWDLTSLADTSARVTLIRFADGGHQVLSACTAKGSVGQWYRFRVDLEGRRLCAYIDGSRVADLILPAPVEGGVGLYLEGPRGAAFDDVSVKTHRRRRLDRAEVLPAPGTGWRTLSDGTLLSSQAAARLALPCRATDRVFTFSAKVPRRAWGFDVALGDGWSFGIAPSGATLMAGAVKARAPVDIGEGTHTFVVDLSEMGRAKLYVDDVLELRGERPDDLPPAFGLANPSAGLSFRLAQIADQREEDLQRDSRVPLFVKDRFMLQWASPQGYWMPADEPNTFWHKGDFYGRYSVSLPMRKQLTLTFGADRRDFDRGYRLDLAPAESPGLLALAGGRPSELILHLRSAGQLMTSERIPAAAPDQALTLHKDGHYIWVTVGEREVLKCRVNDPVPGLTMGIRSTDKLDPNTIRVARNHIKDCQFEEAPADWRTVGWWDVHNRFDCYPHWWHFITWTDGVSTLWHKHRFEGDFTLEYYAGMRMRPWRVWSWYPRLGDVNCMFFGDGRDLASGYSAIIAAWDREWSGSQSRLLKGSTPVAETDAKLIPSRETKYQRPLPVPYIARGRPFHGAWYYIRVRRTGSRIQVWCEDVLAMEYDDPRPIPAGFLGLWTENNFMVVARVSISYTKATVPNIVTEANVAPALSATLAGMVDRVAHGPAGLVPQPPAGPKERVDMKTVWGEGYGGFRADVAPANLRRRRSVKAVSSTHAGLWFDFEDGLQGWRPEEDVTDVELRHVPGMPSVGRCLQLVNVGQGGLFGASVTTPAIALQNVSELSFDYKLSESVKVNLYLKASGEWFYVHLTGDDHSDHFMRRLARIEPKLGRWAKARIDVASAFAQIDPFRAGWTLEEIFIGNRHEGYLRAGFGGNPDRATYSIDNLMIVARGDGYFQAKASPVGPSGDDALLYAFDKDPSTVPGPAATTGGAIERRGLTHGRHYWHVRRRGDAATATVHVPLDVSLGPIRMAGPSPASGSRWGGGDIVVGFEPKTGPGPRLAGARVEANGLAVPLHRDRSRYDAAARRLSFDPRPPGLEAAHGERIDFVLSLATGEPGAIEDWQVIGPFDNTDDSAFDRVDVCPRDLELSPSFVGKGRTITPWAAVTQTAVVDARALYEEDWAALYALAQVDVAADQPATEFLAGFDDWARVWVNGALAFSLKRSGGYTRDEFAFTADLKQGRNTVLMQVGNGVGDWKFGLRMAPPRQQLRWHYIADRGQDATPPSRVEVEGRVADLDFEDGLGSWQGVGASVSRDDCAARSGRYCAKMLNPRLQGSFEASAFRQSFNVGQFPVVAFDYRLSHLAHTDLVVHTAAYGPRNIVLADDDNSMGRLGALDAVKKDGAWHHAEINVADLLARRPFLRNMFDARGMSFGDWGYGANGPTTTYYIDNFTITPVVSCRDGLRLVWSGHDLFGIRGYSHCWSAKPDTDPGERITSLDGDETFTGLPEGERYLHLRACDGSGNWGAPRHLRYLIDNTPPKAEVLRPGPGQTTAATEILLRLSDPLSGGVRSGIAPESLTLAVDGKPVQIHAPLADFAADTGELRWRWCLASGFGSRPVADGARVSFSMPSFKDHAGNAAEGPKWSCVIDYASDHTPPPAPEMVLAAPGDPARFGDSVARPQPYLRFNGFTVSFGDWRTYGSRGAIVEQVYDPERRDYCLALRNEISGSDFGASMCLKPYDAKVHRYVSFDYKFPKGIRLLVMAYVKGQWRCVRLTDSGYRKPNIGSAPKIAADGKWHSTCIDLGSMLERHLRGEPKLTVEKLVIGTWSQRKNGANVTYWVDSFAIFGRGIGTLEPTWASHDPTGIAGYSVVVDKDPDTAPPTRINGSWPNVWALTDGPWYIHARARDAAGHWGPAVHVPYYGPPKPKPEAEPSLHDGFLPEDHEDLEPIEPEREEAETVAAAAD